MARISAPPIGWLLALVLGVAMFSGCLSGGDSSAGPPGGPNGDDEPDQKPDPLAETVESLGPFVEELPEVLHGDGGAVGYVLENETLEPLEGVQVISQCQNEELTLPSGSRLAETDEAGKFLFAAGDILGGCEAISYQALKPGYQTTETLTSGQLEPGLQYLVVLTMEAVG